MSVPHKTSDTDIRLTPTEDLVGEVLAARHRLGEPFFTIDTRHRRAVDGLARKGLASYEPGIVERSLRARLTEAGMDHFLHPGYLPPILDPKCRSYLLRPESEGYPMRVDCDLPRHGAAVPHRYYWPPSLGRPDVTWTEEQAAGPVPVLPARYHTPDTGHLGN